MQVDRKVLSLKGFCYGIPEKVLDSVFNQITSDIEKYKITTVAFDGDLLTYKPQHNNNNNNIIMFNLLFIPIVLYFIYKYLFIQYNFWLFNFMLSIGIIIITTSRYIKKYNFIKNKPVSSYTLLIPRLYEWSKETNNDLEFIYAKKSKSLKKLLNTSNITKDKYGTWLGPYSFLSEDNTYLLDYNMESTPLTWGINIGVGMPDDISWDKLGLEFMKWLNKQANINHVRIYTIGQGPVIEKELELFNLNKNEIPNFTLVHFEFKRE